VNECKPLRSGPSFVFRGEPSRGEVLRCLLKSQKMPLFNADGSPSATGFSGFMAVGNIYGRLSRSLYICPSYISSLTIQTLQSTPHLDLQREPN